MAARAAQASKILTAADALEFIGRHGVVCESARRAAIPALADAIAGAPIRGNWWSHAKSREIFAITRAVREAPDILVCRLIDDKVTFVHERLWPALVRLADRIPRQRLARLREVHTTSGKHALCETAFPDWVPKAVHAAAARLTDTAALAHLQLQNESARCASVTPAREGRRPEASKPKGS